MAKANNETQQGPAAEWVDISKLSLWVKNPRKNDENVARVVESIKRFGFGAPLVARKENGEVIAGHTRLKAAIKLKLKQVPVRYLDISEHEAHLLALADNRLNELSPWDVDGLQEVMGEFSLADIDMAGWSSADLTELGVEFLDGEALSEPAEVVEDEIPEPPKVPVTKPGDVWELGRHRLICGDSTLPATLAKLMGDDRAGLMTTDPPYGVEVCGGSHDPRASTYRAGKTIANDELTGENLERFLRAAFKASLAHLSPGASWYVWYADKETRSFMNAADEIGGFKHVLAWVKPNFVFGRSDYHYRHEPCLYGWVPGAAHSWLGSRNQSTVFEVARDGAVGELKHPTVKPVRLYTIPIENHLGSDGIVLDPFSGSGPAFSAAEQTGRQCFGVELSPAYCDVIVERWENLTGGKAQRRTA
jgi:site-specific DNA-methyltransferase (adenine-specific)